MTCINDTRCQCGQPLPHHLAEVGLETHVCSCHRFYSVIAGKFVHVGYRDNPFARAPGDEAEAKGGMRNG